MNNSSLRHFVAYALATLSLFFSAAAVAQSYPAKPICLVLPVAPAGTPRETIVLLNNEITKVLRLRDIGDRLVADGAVAVGSTPEEFGAYIKSEMTKRDAVIKASGATAD